MSQHATPPTKKQRYTEPPAPAPVVAPPAPAASPAPSALGHAFADIAVTAGDALATAQPAVQRQPAVPVQRDGLQLSPPTLLQPPDPAARYHLGGEMQLQLDPQLEALMQQQLHPDAVLPSLAQINLNVPAAGAAPPPPAGASSAASAPTPAAPTSAATPAAPAPPNSAPADAPPKNASAGDVLKAAALPQVKIAWESLQTQALAQVKMDWGKLKTGEKAGVISTVSVIALGGIAGLATDPAARQTVFDQINGKVIPVPKLSWLAVETNITGENLMFGLHLDVGKFLPSALNFGPASFSAIGGPPQPEPLPGQRRAADDATPSNDALIGERIRASAGRGAALEAPTQQWLEGGLGADLSPVRLHTDSEADHLSRSLGATAFTTGPDIFFRSGAYSPGTSDGQRLLAHEATHTVQQSSGPVAGTPTAGGVAVSDPSDRYEQAAERTADALVQRVDVDAAPNTWKDSAPTHPLARTRIASSAPAVQRHIAVQRYQAGDSGHGGIEQRGLAAAGFAPDAAAQVYLGNWMRDLSQLNDSSFMTQILQVLTLGEFGATINSEDLGTYIPSEHLDNPLGGGTLEDPEVRSDPARLAAAEAELEQRSPAQYRAYKSEEARRHEITEAAKKSGLPEYIERGKMHAKDKLIEAASKPRAAPGAYPPDGLRLMGDALHAVEDYFSHSNFVEVCIWNLYRSGAPVGHLVSKMAQTALGPNAALVGGMRPDGQPQIVTGTYQLKDNDANASANAWVSRLETLKTEVEHGQLTVAFVKGAIKSLGIEFEEVGRALGEATGGVVGGAIGTVAGGVAGTISGGSRGSHIGGALGRRLGGGLGELVGEGVGGVIGGVVGGIGGAITGEAEGEREGADIGGDAFGAVGDVAGTGLGVLGVGSAGLVVLSIEQALNLMLHFPAIGALLNSLFEAAIQHLTDLSAKQAADHKDPATGKPSPITGPTHSQLAKDAPDHALFGVSAALAQEAVRGIGEAMKHAWDATPVSSGAPASGSSTPADGNNAPTPGGAPTVAPAPPSPEVKAATDLVDKYVSAPASDPWWQPIVTAASK